MGKDERRDVRRGVTGGAGEWNRLLRLQASLCTQTAAVKTSAPCLTKGPCCAGTSVTPLSPRTMAGLSAVAGTSGPC